MRDGGHGYHLVPRAPGKVAHALMDKNTIGGLYPVGKQAGEGENPHRLLTPLDRIMLGGRHVQTLAHVASGCPFLSSISA